MNNKRKVLRLMAICVGVALPCLASADAPSDMAVGEVDAILKFCVKSDPRLEESAEKWRKLLGGTGSRGSESSAAYKQGYDLVTNALEHTDKTSVRAACIVGLTGSEHAEHREARHEHGGDR